MTQLTRIASPTTQLPALSLRNLCLPSHTMRLFACGFIIRLPNIRRSCRALTQKNGQMRTAIVARPISTC